MSNNQDNNNSNRPSCTILYSTQTGRARACARRTARILRETTRLRLLGGTSFDELTAPSFLELAASSTHNNNNNNNNHFFLFFVSTTGDGVHCDSIQTTWKALLKKSLAPQVLQGGRFALFCLGDRAYGPQFCAAGRKLAVRLLQLGMTTTCEVGYGDDNTPNGGVFNDLDRWIQTQLLVSSSSSLQLDKNTTLSGPPNEPEQTANSILDTSHYKVTIQETTSTPKDDLSTAAAEWQQEWCRESHRSFVASRSPMTAYAYHGPHRVDPTNGSIQSSKNINNNNPLIGHVESNERLTASNWDQNTRHIRLRVVNDPTDDDGDDTASSSTTGTKDVALPYQAGDIATILPSNPSVEVDRFIETLPSALQIIVDRQLVLDYQNLGQEEASFGGAYPFWPRHCTLRGWLTYCADIHSLPEREDLRALSQFCSPQHSMYEAQRDKLFSLSETSQSALYVDYILREKRCWTDVIYDFDSLRDADSKLTVEALLTLLPPIRPRDFSIASSPSHEILQSKEQQQQSSNNGFIVELCVAVVEGTTPLGRTHHGLCSHYLWRLQTNQSQVRLWIRPGSFAGLPLAPQSTPNATNAKAWFENPVLCIGAGTGVAPLRALILEREAVKQLSQPVESATEGTNGGAELDQYDNLLVFGCRKKEADYYYQEEWNRLHQSGRLFVLPAFSREQARKIYVQQLVKANGDAILKHILENDGAIYIAGNPSMARYTKEELVEATARLLGENGEKKANVLFKKLQARGRFSVEAWS